MAEFWDVVDKNGNLTGRTHERSKPMNDGDYHLLMLAFIFIQILVLLRTKILCSISYRFNNKEEVNSMVIRVAVPSDAEQLFLLNEKFNGKGETTVDNIRNSLSNNNQEIVIVAEDSEILIGFLSMQIKRSFCYKEVMIEITELFVDDKFRRLKATPHNS